MKHLFIVNPVAGGKDHTREVRAKVEKAFAQRGGEFEIYVTRAPMDATDKILAEAASGEHIRVYACGGDGTFNECVCGAAQLPNVAICPFPTGTGNDFCRMFGDEAELYRDLDALLDGEERPIDLIDCNGRWCSNICSVGIDARIGTSVHDYSHLPLIGGAAGYVVSAVVNMFKGINRNMYIKCGDFYEEGMHALVCVCNGRYYGGGFNPPVSPPAPTTASLISSSCAASTSSRSPRSSASTPRVSRTSFRPISSRISRVRRLRLALTMTKSSISTARRFTAAARR